MGLSGARIKRDGRVPPTFETLPRLLARRGGASFQAGKFREGSYEDGGFTDGVTRVPTAAFGVGSEAEAIGRSTMQPVWDFLRRHRESPFFLWFAPTLPHLPYDPGAEHRALYGETGVTGAYLANVTRFDAVVGQLLARLDELELRERTLVVYLADNGIDFRIEEEPEEQRDLSRERADVVARLRGELDDLVARSLRAAADLGRAADSGKPG